MGLARCVLLAAVVAGCAAPPAKPSGALVRHDQPRPYAAVRFTPASAPKIDGDLADWSGVSRRYWIGADQMFLDRARQSDDDLEVCVGYCAETGQVYFAVRATDDHLKADRQHTDPERYYPFHDDIFEIAIDGDTSGGDYIRFKQKTRDGNRRLCGCHAQNYHVYLIGPPGASHAWLWGDQKWLLAPPYAAFASRHQGSLHGPGRVTLEFYVTPFNYADASGPERSAQAVLVPGATIGIGWLRLDEDGLDEQNRRKGDQYYFGHHIRLYRDADHCFEFALDPAVPGVRPPRTGTLRPRRRHRMAPPDR